MSFGFENYGVFKCGEIIPDGTNKNIMSTVSSENKQGEATHSSACFSGRNTGPAFVICVYICMKNIEDAAGYNQATAVT